MSRHGHKEIERIKQLAAKMNTASLPFTQQELNVRFAKALGWTYEECRCSNVLCTTKQWYYQNAAKREFPNYFAPENFHLVRAAVGALGEIEQYKLFRDLIYSIGLGDDNSPSFVAPRIFLSPVEHIITAYLKVKESK